jgi:hypothetical protein
VIDNPETFSGPCIHLLPWQIVETLLSLDFTVICCGKFLRLFEFKAIQHDANHDADLESDEHKHILVQMVPMGGNFKRHQNR